MQQPVLFFGAEQAQPSQPLSGHSAQQPSVLGASRSWQHCSIREKCGLRLRRAAVFVKTACVVCFRHMPTDMTTTSRPGGLDTAIKVLTIFKLLFQLAFYGLLLGGTIWFLVNNPLPKMIQGIQEQVVKSFMSGGK